MELNQGLSAEDVFAQVSDLVAGQQMTPNAAMSLAAQALCLMAVAWRPADAETASTQRFVHDLVEAWLQRMNQHPFAAGRLAN